MTAKPTPLDPCLCCEIRRACDFLSGMCNLTPREIARFRPELVRTEVLPDAQHVYNRRSYAKHADKRREDKRRYYAKNPEAVKTSQAKYRAKTDRREYFRQRYAQRTNSPAIGV